MVELPMQQDHALIRGKRTDLVDLPVLIGRDQAEPLAMISPLSASQARYDIAAFSRVSLQATRGRYWLDPGSAIIKPIGTWAAECNDRRVSA